MPVLDIAQMMTTRSGSRFEREVNNMRIVPELESFYSEHEVSARIDGDGNLRIWVDDIVVADISHCKRMSKNGIRLLIDEILTDFGYCD